MLILFLISRGDELVLALDHMKLIFFLAECKFSLFPDSVPSLVDTI